MYFAIFNVYLFAFGVMSQDGRGEESEVLNYKKNREKMYMYKYKYV